MNNKTFLAIAATVAVLTLTSRADLIDNFDSYANQAALTVVWTADTGTGLQLSQSAPTPASGANDVMNTTTASARMHATITGGVAANALDWTFKFYDNNGSRDYANLYAYTGAWTAGLQTDLAMGTYNTGTASKYMGRYSAITGAVYGDGAVATTGDAGTGGWFSLTSAANRSVGWHTMEVKGMADPVYTGKLELKFYIDGTLGGSISALTSYNLTFATLGGAVSTTASGAAYDDFSVATAAIPEPSTLALSLLGGLGLAATAISRRRRA